MLKRGPDACPVGRVPAAEIESAVIDQLRGIFRQPEMVVGTWRPARAEQDDITEDEAREALTQLDVLWDELFPAEQARIVQLLVERVDVRMQGVEVRLRPNGSPGWCAKLQAAGGRRREADDSLSGRRDDHRPHPSGVQEARRAEAGGDAGWGRVGAATAGRQRDGQGAGAGVPVAEAAGRGRARDAGGSGPGEGVHATYVSRVLRLTLLAPEIVEAILDGRQPAELQLDDLLDGFLLDWKAQIARLVR